MNQEHLFPAEWTTTILEGDCREILPTLPENSIDFIITSPPYANARQKQYGGIPHDEYVNWFLPISAELFRVLKPTASMIINIKENCVNGERSCYVIDLIKALRNQGFRWTEEWIWSKKNAMPGKWKNRFRDAWERLLQFNKTKDFNMYQNAVMIRRQESTAQRAARISSNSTLRTHSASGSQFSRNNSAWIGREWVYPTNVLHLAVETTNKKHSAVFPESLPEWFIKLFTVEGDTVLDPFSGSGTVGVVCRRLKRNFIGIEKVPEYVTLSRERIFKTNSKHQKEEKNALSVLPLFSSRSSET